VVWNRRRAQDLYPRASPCSCQFLISQHRFPDDAGNLIRSHLQFKPRGPARPDLSHAEAAIPSQSSPTCAWIDDTDVTGPGQKGRQTRDVDRRTSRCKCRMVRRFQTLWEVGHGADETRPHRVLSLQNPDGRQNNHPVAAAARMCWPYMPGADDAMLVRESGSTNLHIHHGPQVMEDLRCSAIAAPLARLIGLPITRCSRSPPPTVSMNVPSI
jgi:hypothetical protein